jgi:hypothetical protein
VLILNTIQAAQQQFINIWTKDLYINKRTPLSNTELLRDMDRGIYGRMGGTYSTAHDAFGQDLKDEL